MKVEEQDSEEDEGPPPGWDQPQPESTGQIDNSFWLIVIIFYPIILSCNYKACVLSPN